MKKISLLLFVNFFILSCSKDDDAINTASINPPTWIQGTWRMEGAPGGGYRFTNDDLILLGSNEISHKHVINNYHLQGIEVIVTEYISPEEYTIRMKFSNGNSITHSFNKIDNSTLHWIGRSEYVELKKQ